MLNAQRSIGWFKHTEYSDSEGTKLTVNRNGYEHRTAADDNLEELNVNFVRVKMCSGIEQAHALHIKYSTMHRQNIIIHFC